MGIYSSGAYIGATSIEDAGNASIKITSVGDDCVKDACIRNACVRNAGAVKDACFRNTGAIRNACFRDADVVNCLGIHL